jgi:CO dehydrogenase maturation factor
MYGWTQFARSVIVVVDPSAKSLLAARRLARAGVGTHVVANKIETDADVKAISAGLALPLLGVVPYDPEVAEAEQCGKAPIDVAPESPAVRAIGDLATHLQVAAR